MAKAKGNGERIGASTEDLSLGVAIKFLSVGLLVTFV